MSTKMTEPQQRALLALHATDNGAGYASTLGVSGAAMRGLQSKGLVRNASASWQHDLLGGPSMWELTESGKTAARNLAALDAVTEPEPATVTEPQHDEDRAQHMADTARVHSDGDTVTVEAAGPRLSGWAARLALRADAVEFVNVRAGYATYRRTAASEYATVTEPGTDPADVVRSLLSKEPREFGRLAAMAARKGIGSRTLHVVLTGMFDRGEATITHGQGWHLPAEPETVPADSEPAVLTLERSQVEDAAHAEMTRHFLAGRTTGMVPAEPFGSEHGGTYWAQAWGRDEWRHWVTLPTTEADAQHDADDPIRAVRETIGKALQAATDVIDDHVARAGFMEEEASATLHAFLSAQVVYRLAWDLGLEELHDPFPAFPTADPTESGK